MHKERPMQHRGKAPARANESKSIGSGYSRPGCIRAVPAVMKMPPGGSRCVPFILCESATSSERVPHARKVEHPRLRACCCVENRWVAKQMIGRPLQVRCGIEGRDLLRPLLAFSGLSCFLGWGQTSPARGRNQFHLFFILIYLNEYPLLNLAHLTSPLVSLHHISPSSSSQFISVQGSSFNLSSQQLVASSRRAANASAESPRHSSSLRVS